MKTLHTNERRVLVVLSLRRATRGTEYTLADYMV